MSSNGSITWTNEQRRLRDLIPWEHNPRQINRREAERLGNSLAEFGQIQTIAVGPDNEILDGHQRKAVWSLLPQFGPDHLVDVRVASRALTDKERQKLVVYLHRGTVGDWDFDLLANEFEVPDLLEWGFEESELQLDWGSDATPDPGAQVDKAAELQEKWQVKRGDVWQCGRHRVMCGDSTCAGDVARLMGGEKAGAVVTDPPYGMNLDTDWSGIRRTGQSLGFKKSVRGKAYAPVQGDDKPFEPVPILELWAENATEVFLFGADYYAERIPSRIDGSWLVWDKRKESQSDGFGSEFELIWSRARHKRRVLRHEWFGFLREGEHGEVRTHPTQKPVALIKDIIEQWCDEDIIVDPFLGSGTTLVACEQTGRVGYGMEIEPKYVAVTLERLAGMGLEAQLLPGVP